MAAIFVETHIAAPIDRVWELTQDPCLHQRWDLRFSQIRYVPKRSPDDATEPQRFHYETRIGLGLMVAGAGESVGERNRADGTRTSALKFWSDDPKALIREGSGYWQYEPDSRGTVFRTSYDYRVRYGVLGRLIDLGFRPMLGTATAWSFAALRRWIEDGVAPEISILQMRIHAVCRVALVVIWLYHGIVPKLLFPALGELELVRAAGVAPEFAPYVPVLGGLVEVALAIALVAWWRTRWLLLAQAVLPCVLPLGLIAATPEWFAAPFNPVTLAIGMVALGIAGYLASHRMPSAATCRRKPAR